MRSRPSVGVDRAFLGRLLAEELLEHLQRCGCRRVAAVAAVLDQRADDQVRRIRRAVAAPPRLVERSWVAVARVDALLSRARLARDRDREAAEDRGRGAKGGV